MNHKYFTPFVRNKGLPPYPSLRHLSLSLSRKHIHTQLAANHSRCIAELIPQPGAETAAERNRRVVLRLYEALNARDVETVQQLLAPDIEWRFHGLPACQHMMRILTGADKDDHQTNTFSLRRSPSRPSGPTPIVEGRGSDRSGLLWVHAWTVDTHGVITQVREYFNTTLTVRRLAGATAKKSAAAVVHCLPVWRNKLHDRAGKSLPGLVLAI